MLTKGDLVPFSPVRMRLAISAALAAGPMAALPCAPANPNWLVAPDRMNSKFVPSDSMREVMDSCAPRPMAINVMTAETPMMMPNRVNPERSLLELTASIAVRNVVSGFMRQSPSG